MKNARKDQRRVTMRYLHDGVSGVTTLTVDVEVPEDDMPHEHRQDLRAMAEEILGVPLGSLPEGITVNLRRAQGHLEGSPGGNQDAHSHPHPEGEHSEAGHTEPEPARRPARPCRW